MKTKYIISTLFLSLGLVVIGQTTIYTPWGSAVSVHTPQNDMTPWQRDQKDQEHSDFEDEGARFQTTFYGDGDYPWPSSTSRFNCHGYAWYMYWQTSPLSAPWNMNLEEAETFFNDPSFTECSEEEADILWINEGAHSALTTLVEDELLSKWATGPFAIHGKDDGESPWPTTSPNTVTYYKECSRIYKGKTFIADEDVVECAVKLENSNISSNVDLDIEYEVAVLIEGTFTTATGAELYIHPE